jgi:predicted Rossmann-fold nucleotide-binding protein
MGEFRVLVCGSRNGYDERKLSEFLDRLNLETPINQVITGGGTGVDQQALDWAKSLNIDTKVYPADWDQFGRAAGPIRNQQMADLKPDLVVAFPGGRGTADMVRRALKSVIKVIQVE